jgi:ribosomal protein S18 acetylase RimI-like enzyme
MEDIILLEKEKSWFDKAKKIWREKGIFGLLRAVFLKLFELLFETNSAIWFKRDLSQPIEEFQAKIPLTFVSDSPQRTLAWFRSFGLSYLVHPKEIETGIEEKHYFFYVHKDDGEIVGGRTVGYGKVYIADFEGIVNFPEGIAFNYNIYVPPAMRGLGIATYLITQSLLFSKQKGYRKVMCHIPKWNQASIKAVTRCGFKKIKYVRFFRLFSFKFTVPSLNKIIK